MQHTPQGVHNLSIRYAKWCSTLFNVSTNIFYKPKWYKAGESRPPVSFMYMHTECCRCSVFVATLRLLLQQKCCCFLLMFGFVCRMVNFSAGSWNLIPVFSLSSTSAAHFSCTLCQYDSRCRTAYIRGNSTIRGAKAGVSPRRRRPPCIHTMFIF